MTIQIHPPVIFAGKLWAKNENSVVILIHKLSVEQKQNESNPHIHILVFVFYNGLKVSFVVMA